jgi:hypothetical protein
MRTPCTHRPGHPNVLRLVDAFEDDGCVHLVMELCSGGEVLERLVSKVGGRKGWPTGWEDKAPAL